MKEYDKIPAQAVVEVTTSWGRTCLREIGRDLKEGTVLDGYYYPVSKAFDFYWKGEDVMLWIGDNGRLVSLGEGQKHKYMMLCFVVYYPIASTSFAIHTSDTSISRASPGIARKCASTGLL